MIYACQVWGQSPSGSNGRVRRLGADVRFAPVGLKRQCPVNTGCLISWGFPVLPDGRSLQVQDTEYPIIIAKFRLGGRPPIGNWGPCQLFLEAIGRTGPSASRPLQKRRRGSAKKIRRSRKPRRNNCLWRGAGGSRTHGGGFAIRCLSHLATAPNCWLLISDATRPRLLLKAENPARPVNPTEIIADEARGWKW